MLVSRTQLDVRSADGRQVTLAGLRGEIVELLRPKGGSPLVAGTFELPEDADLWQRQMGELETFLGYVAELEAWLGERT